MPSASEWTLAHVFCFIQLARILKTDILLAQPSTHNPTDAPIYLAPSISKFISSACNIDKESVDIAWTVLKDEVWNENPLVASVGDAKSIEETFRKHGMNLGFSHTLFPPCTSCINPNCSYSAPDKGLKLQAAQQRAAVLYTLHLGVLPVWSVHLECKGCNINYHHDYFVKAGQRTYYDTIPDILQIGEHQFAERQLISMWRINMNVAWMSAENCANTYLLCRSDHQLPEPWQFGATLSHKHVYDGFVLLSLLEDCNDRNSTLVIPHTGPQNDRFTLAMEARNQRIHLYGQPELRHHCKKCVREFPPTEISRTS
ncbi:hypothetical protein BD779DRAFT_1447120 [Infundibulicybe gibba]|nr:hypothetical protein BD779DRAFT_1447120 [Infundibulicybe gibba]